MPSSKVVLRDLLKQYEKSATAGADGRFLFSNVPPGECSLTVEASGFQEAREELTVQSGTAVALTISMKMAGAQTLVEVSANSGLIAPDAISADTAIAEARIEERSGVGGSHALQEIVAAAPGFVTENDGLLHVRGVDDGVLYVMDGIPMMDRIDALTGAAPDLNAIRSMNVITGGIPAEFGGRSGAVVLIDRKSGLDSDWKGTIASGVGSFNAAEVDTAAGGSLGKKLGVFVTGSFSQSDRFLDPPGPGNLNNHGITNKVGIRLDFKAGEQDRFVMNASTAAIDFQVPNTSLQELEGQRERQRFRNDAESLAWNRIWSTNVQTNLAAYRQAYSAQLSGSPQDTPLFAAQDRGHARQGMGGDLIAVFQGHIIKSGAGVSSIAAHEFFNFAVTDPQTGSQ
jgi:hypothetical protein